MQDSLDLVSLGQGHLLQQGHQLGIPVEHQRVTLSYDCIPQAFLHNAGLSHGLASSCAHADLC